MGNSCSRTSQQLNPGAVLDRVYSQASSDDDCLLYKLANYKKGGELIDAHAIGGAIEVEKLVREQFGILMYKDGRGQIISRTEYLRWKFRNLKHVVIPVVSTSATDPLGKWDDHEACWQMQYRGSLGETLLHVLIICDTRLHSKLARILLKCFPKLALDVFEGEEYLGASALHLAIAYNNNELVRLLVQAGAQIQQRAIGSFFLPRDQQRMRPAKFTDYEGLAYLGEYPLAWAACMGNESVYNLLVDEDADPDAQDSFGNMVLHMVVVTDQLGMYGYALRHPQKVASNGITNDQGLTPLTLACRLGRASVFREMLELSCREFWRYSNITCSAYPLNALDTILPDGRTNWNSALFMILAGSKEEHLNMLEGGIIQRLLEEKWKTFAQRQFLKRISIALVHLLVHSFISIALYLRPSDHSQPLSEYRELADLVRMGFEVATIIGCLSFVVVQQGGEIKNQGFLSFIKQLPHAPPKAMFLIANFLILSCIPCRLVGQVQVEESLLTVAMVGSWFFMIFFAGAIKLTGPFVTMVYSMITGDMLTFGIIYLIFILAFAPAFYFLYLEHPKDDLLFEHFHTTWMALYQMTLGQYNYEELSQGVYPTMAKTVFILFMILVPILLLNMLIAMMGNTYSQVIERSEKEWVKQWAKIVVTLELAVSQDDCKKYLEDYSIKLGGSSDPSVELRGVMVIKTKSKTRAKQRKGAMTNWKRVGKVTITALKRRKMTGEEMRQLMWGHRSSICTPTAITPRQQSLDVDVVNPLARKDAIIDMSGLNNLNSGGLSDTSTGSRPGNVFDCLDESLSAAGLGGVSINETNPQNVPADQNQDRVHAKMAKRTRRNITTGLRPKIVIFSEKKDLIRVSLDTDDSDLDFAETVPYPSTNKYHRMKSARRKSIAGNGADGMGMAAGFSSSAESLGGDTDIEDDMKSLSPRVDVTSAVTGRGVDNFAFENDAGVVASSSRAPPPAYEATVDTAATKSKKGRPKSASGKKTPSTKLPKAPLDEIVEKAGECEPEAPTQPGASEDKSKKDKKERSKSAKTRKGSGSGNGNGGNGHSSEKGSSNGEEQGRKSRPQTAFSRNTDDVTNMSKIVAWDRPEDNI